MTHGNRLHCQLGMAPMSAIEAKAAEADEIVLADNVTGNNFTDTTANPDESYVYTIEGSDGSVQEIGTYSYTNHESVTFL